MSQELLHRMQEKLPIFLLTAAGLLDVSGASRNEHQVSLSFPGEAQPGAESSPVPREAFSIREDNLDEVTVDFQSPAAGSTNETGADSPPARTEAAAARAAVLPEVLLRSSEVPEQPSAEAAALNPWDGQAAPGQVMGSVSTPVSTRGSQAAAHRGQLGGSPQGRSEEMREAALSPASPHAGLPQQAEVPGPQTSPLPPAVSFHPPRRDTAAPLLPSRVTMGRVRVGWVPAGASPTSHRADNATPQGQPDSRDAAATPLDLKKPRSLDANVTASASVQDPASGDLGTAHSTPTQAGAAEVAPVLSLKQDTSGSRARSSTAAAGNGSGHPTPSPALQTLPRGNTHSSSLLMPLGALVQEGRADRQQPQAVSQPLSCSSQQVSPEANRSSDETSVLGLQRDPDHRLVTAKPQKSPAPGSPQASAPSSLLIQAWVSTLKPSQRDPELLGVTAPLPPGSPALGNAALQPANPSASARAGLWPPGPSSPPSDVGQQTTSTSSSAERALHIPALPSPAGSQGAGIAGHPASQEASPGLLLLLSTVGGSRKGLQQQTGTPGSPLVTPQASTVPRTELQGNGDHRVPPQSLVPSSAQPQRAGSPPAFPSNPPLPRAQGSQSSSTTEHPEPPVVPGGAEETPAGLAAALVQQLGASQGAAHLGEFRSHQLTLLPSSPSLSFLMKSSEGTICLQPTQDSSLPAEFPSTSLGGLLSIQQVLAASNSSALDPVNLRDLSLILVKPVFILLPRPGLQAEPSAEGEDDNRTALSLTARQDLHQGSPASSHNIPVRTSSSYPTSKSWRTGASLPTASPQGAGKREGPSQPGLTTPPHPATTTWLPAAPLLEPWMRISTTAQATRLPGAPGEMLVPAPSSQEARGAGVVTGLSAASPTSPVPAPGHPSAAKGPPDLQPPLTLTATGDQVHHSKTLPLQTTGHSQDLVATAASGRVQCSECSTSGSAGATKYPTEVFSSITPPRSTSPRLPGTEPLHRLLSPVQWAPSSSPAGKGRRDPSAGSTAGSGLAAHTTAAPTHGTPVKPSLSTPLELTPVPPKASGRTERAASPPAQPSSPAEVPTVPGKLLPTVAYPRTGSTAPPSPAAPAQTRVPLLSATKAGQGHRAPPELLSTEISPTGSSTGAGRFVGTRVSLPTPSDSKTQQPPSETLGSTPAQPPVSAASVPALGRPPASARTTEQSPSAGAPLSSAKDGSAAVSLTNIKAFHLPPSTTRAGADLLLPATAGVSKAAVGSISTGKSEGTVVKGGAATTSELPTRAPLSLSHQRPVSPSHQAPVSPSHQGPVSPSHQGPVSPSYQAPISSSHQTPESSSHQRQVSSSYQAPVSPPHQAPVSPSHQAPVSPSHQAPVSPPHQAPVSPPHQVPISSTHEALMSSPHLVTERRPLEKMSLEANAEHETGHSSPDTVSRATGLPAAKASSVSANGLVGGAGHQSAGFSKVGDSDAEMLLAGDLIQLLPTLESPSYSPQALVALTPQGGPLLAVAGTGEAERLLLSTEAEEMAGTNGATEEAAEELVTVLTLLDLEPRALLSESQQRRGLQPEATALNSLTTVSDDACGSGNYTVQMTLSPVAEADPEVTEPQETFLAFISVQSNSSQPLLQVQSCCVTPSASPGAPGATCCLFRRLPFECRHIQVLPSSKPRAASFTIQLFQMLNHSVAYLHCELSVCLQGHAGCEQDCSAGVELPLQAGDRTSRGNPHNLISLGPVLRMTNRFSYRAVEGADSVMLVPLLLGSLTGFAVLGSAFVSLWLHHRQKTRPSQCPQLEETHGP